MERDIVTGKTAKNRPTQFPDPFRRCPRLRPVTLEWLYPVAGYCVLGHRPGWYMIPSIAEYRTYCTTERFPECVWYRKSEQATDQEPLEPPQDVVQPWAA